MTPFQSLSPGVRRLAYAAAAVPTVVVGTGLVQGISVLIDYHLHHKDAPQPISPASGTVMISSRDSDDINTVQRPQHQLHNTSTKQRPPLRLLVVGDSLAVGVGMSGSASPVLPESIARSLSNALGGRAVRWTCIGTSGASAGRIVRDIESFHTKHDGDGNDSDADENRQRRIVLPKTRARIRSWLDKNLVDDHDTESSEESGRQKIRKVKDWLRKRIDSIDWLKDEEELGKRYEWKNWRGRSRDPRSVSPTNVRREEYDVAVVLTGLNDVKDAVLPFLSSYSKEERRARRQERQGFGGYEEELTRILQVLKERMNLTESMDIPDESKLSESRESRGSYPISNDMSPKPLIVLPGLPAKIVPVFQWIPLKWFLVPLINSVDKQKRNTSQLYPGSVLFVESPAVSAVEQYESGLGSNVSRRRAERALFVIQDISQRAKEKVEEAMNRYYEFDNNTTDCEEKEVERQYEQSYHQHGSAARPIAYSPPPGSKLFSPDGIHPNDDGYDYYGRHIAASIVQEWAQHYTDDA